MLRHFFHQGRTYFELDHRQAKAYLWLLLFTLLIMCSPLFTYYWYPVSNDAVSVQLFVEEASKEDLTVSTKTEVQRSISFQLPIDQMKEEDWIKTGLPAYLAKRIEKYQAKVRQLKKVSDLHVVYGMDSSRVVQVSPYLLDAVVMNKRVRSKKQESPFKMFDINAADSSMLEFLPAIGPVLSKRILKYRELLKGYVRKEQYAEIYAINPDALAILQKRTIIKTIPVVCALKSADYQKLNGHFYLSGKDARYLVGQLKLNSSLCWDELKNGLEPNAQKHVEELKLYYPCE
ncbi:MAG TPA: helix-hairpin-helix domain-containing protein [Cytophagaceae bacterium]|jgi:DNA uptake protein ComE-like DNA-binding protein|nr:helix-hairpin-helix domain-containing protein [Cytophagaceae bacterium]